MKKLNEEIEDFEKTQRPIKFRVWDFYRQYFVHFKFSDVVVIGRDKFVRHPKFRTTTKIAKTKNTIQ